MDNYKAENQEQEIDLVSLFFAVAHRYKQMAAAAVICAVLFGGFSVVKGMLNQRAIDEAIANGEVEIFGVPREKVFKIKVNDKDAVSAHYFSTVRPRRSTTRMSPAISSS